MPAEVHVTVKRAWWLTPYFYGVALMSALTGLEPNWGKVDRVIKKALTFKVG